MAFRRGFGTPSIFIAFALALVVLGVVFLAGRPVTVAADPAPSAIASVKQVSTTAGVPGQAITYTVVLTNTGGVTATVQMTDTLPTNLSYVQGSAGVGVVYDGSSRSIRWSGVVSATSAVSVTYRATITSPIDNGTLITNTASINDGYNAPFETAPVTTTVSSSPDLSSSRKTVNKPLANPGGTIGYSIAVNNTGGVHTTARVTDTLPISLTYVSTSLQSTMGTAVYDSSNRSIYWTGPALAGTPITISYQASVPTSTVSGAIVTNTATIQAGGSAAVETPPVTVTIASNPSRIGWTNLGLYGAIVSSIEVDPINGVVYQSGSANPGVYRTTDGGNSWTATRLPSNCGPVIVEQSLGVSYVNCQQNLWKTTDAGVTWTNVLTRSTSASGFQGIAGGMVVTGTTLYVGDNQGGIWKSTDSGANWTQTGTVVSGTAVMKLAVDPANTAVLYGVTSSKVFSSTNSGATWTDLAVSDTGFTAVAVSPFNSNTVYVGTGDTRHLWRSTNGGASWTSSNPNVSVPWVKFSLTDPNTIYVQSAKSTDGGATWQGWPVAGGGMAFDPRNPSIVYGNSGHGVQKSTDGGATWTEIDTGLEEVPIDAVVQNPQDPNHYFVGSRTGRGRSFDGGINWTWPLEGGAGFAVAMDASKVLVADNGLDRSTDGGRTWTASDLRTKQEADLGPGRSSQVHDIAIVSSDPQHVFAALAEPSTSLITPKGGVYESTDGGLTWSHTGLLDLPVNAIGVGAATTGTILYAGVGDEWGTLGIPGGVYTSTVGNTSTWTRTSLTDPYIWKLQVDPSNPLVVYAGGVIPQSSQGPAVTALYKSTNGGASWTSLLPSTQMENALRAIAIDPANSNNIYYSAASKVYQSVDAGQTWTLFADADMGGEGINALLVPVVAPSPVVTFTASISGSQATLSWTNPSDSDFAGVTIKYSASSFPALSTEGITVTTPLTGTAGASQTVTQTGVVSGTTYYYSAFARNQAGRYSLPFQTSASSAATALSVAASALQVRLPASLPVRPASEATTRNLYVAAGAGLFATSIASPTQTPTPSPLPSPGTIQKTYIPAMMKGFAGAW